MARNVRKASDEVDRPCRISMDLPGPKMRTGPLVEGPRVVRVRPERDLRGVAVAPATLQLISGDLVEGETTPALPVDAEWLHRRKPGDVVGVVDARGSHRHLRVVTCAPGVSTAEAWDTAYVETGAQLNLRRRHHHRWNRPSDPPAPSAAHRRPVAADGRARTG